MAKVKNILHSVRFQQMALAVVLAALISEGHLGEGFVELLGTMIATISGISAGVGTVDRFSEKIGKRS